MMKSESLLTVDEITRGLRVNARKVYQFIQSGELVAINISAGDRKIFRIARSGLEAFLQARKVKRQQHSYYFPL